MYESDAAIGLTKVQGEVKTYKKFATPQEYTPWAFPNIQDEENPILTELPPCTFGYPIIEYLNRADVRQLLHIPSNIQAWDLCTSEISYTEDVKGSYWIYEQLQDKYRKLIYSGDCDGAVPTEGTLRWIQDLNSTITENWRPFYWQGQVAGYLERREALDFITVHGAGHMVPQDKRAQAFYAISHWLKGETF